MPKQPDKFLTVVEAASLLGIAPWSLRAKRCGTGELTRVKMGKLVMYSHNDIQAFISRKLRKAQEDQNKAQVSLMASKQQIQRAVLRVIDGYKGRR